MPLCESDHVEVVGETYRGQVGSRKQSTSHKEVIILDTNPEKERSLSRHNVRLLKPPSVADIFDSPFPSFVLLDGNVVTATLPHTISNGKFSAGDVMEVVGGTYKGQVGLWKHSTAHREVIILVGDPKDKERKMFM